MTLCSASESAKRPPIGWYKFLYVEIVQEFEVLEFYTKNGVGALLKDRLDFIACLENLDFFPLCISWEQVPFLFSSYLSLSLSVLPLPTKSKHDTHE